MGPASDLRQKECPRLLSRPAPLAALHTVISGGAFCVHLPDPKTPEQRPQTSTQQHAAAPRHRCTAHYNLTVVELQPLYHLGLRGGIFPLLPLATKMLIASQSQSLKSLTYCVDGIPPLLSPFMWVLMYCLASAL